MPVYSKTQKLSKIETLRLAKNYISILGRMMESSEQVGSSELAKSLSYGLSQGTSNLIAGFLHLNPRTLIPSRPTSSVHPVKPIHYDVFEPNGILRDYVAMSYDQVKAYDVDVHNFPMNCQSYLIPSLGNEDDTLMSNSSTNSSSFTDDSMNTTGFGFKPRFSQWSHNLPSNFNIQNTPGNYENSTYPLHLSERRTTSNPEFSGESKLEFSHSDSKPTAGFDWNGHHNNSESNGYIYDSVPLV